MKKVLLVASAALVAISASADGMSAKAGKAMMQNQAAPVSEVMNAKFQAQPALNVKPQLVKSDLLSKVLDVKTLDAAALAPAHTAAAVQDVYNGRGFSLADSETQTWEMMSGKLETGAPALVDVIPASFVKGELPVEYTLEGNNIVIPTQLVASGSTQDGGMMYIYILDAVADEITLTLDAKGNITGKYEILYGAFASEDPFTFGANYLGYYDYYQNVSYSLPGAAAVAPEVSFEPANTMLFAGLGLSGYSFTHNLGVLPAFADFKFKNNTADDATAWSWTVGENEDNTLTSSKKDFVFAPQGGNMYVNATLVGTNQTAVSEPFTWGTSWIANSTESEATPYEFCYMYAGSTESQFEFSDGTTATMSTFNPDGDLTFYTNWATPDRASNSMSKIYLYQGKPAAPLYIEGITIPLVSATFTPDFNLHISIVKCTVGSRPQLGEVIAQADASLDNVNDEFAATSGLTAINFNELYIEDEDGMSEDIDHLFIEDEFMIVIDGWDNGTFAGVPGCADIYDANGGTKVWFEMTGAPGSFYSYSTWKTNLWVGYLGAAMGYLKTDDATTVTLDGSEPAVLHIEPMLCSVDEAGNPATRLFLEDEDSVPEWLSLYFANEVYDETGYSFDLVLEAEAGDADEATFVLFQEGAKLPITVKRADAAGINSVAVKNNNSQIYNLQGQKVAKAEAGIFVQNGVKFIAK